MKNRKEVFSVEKPIIGMLHLSGLGRDEVMDIARREIDIMYRNGVNAVLVENYFGDKTDVEHALKCLYEVYPNTEPLANSSLTALPWMCVSSPRVP